MNTKRINLTESDIHEFVNRVARRLVKEDVLGNNWHEADDTVYNNYEPFGDQKEKMTMDDVAYEPYTRELPTGGNIHDQSIVGDEDLDPTVYGESRRPRTVMRMTESDLLGIIEESVKRAVNRRLNESNELYDDEYYGQEDYDGNTGKPGLIKSYDIGMAYTPNMEADAEENGMSFDDYLQYYIEEILPDCPWYWVQKSNGPYKTLAQWDGIVVKELPGDQIVVDEYPIADAERDRAFQNKLEQGEYWMK